MREKINYVRAAKEFAYLITYTRLLCQQSDNLLIRGSVTGPGRIEEDEGGGGGGGGSSSNSRLLESLKQLNSPTLQLNANLRSFISHV